MAWFQVCYGILKLPKYHIPRLYIGICILSPRTVHIKRHFNTRWGEGEKKSLEMQLLHCMGTKYVKNIAKSLQSTRWLARGESPSAAASEAKACVM